MYLKYLWMQCCSCYCSDDDDGHEEVKEEVEKDVYCNIHLYAHSHWLKQLVGGGIDHVIRKNAKHILFEPEISCFML